MVVMKTKIVQLKCEDMDHMVVIFMDDYVDGKIEPNKITAMP